MRPPVRPGYDSPLNHRINHHRAGHVFHWRFSLAGLACGLFSSGGLQCTHGLRYDASISSRENANEKLRPIANAGIFVEADAFVVDHTFSTTSSTSSTTTSSSSDTPWPEEQPGVVRLIKRLERLLLLTSHHRWPLQAIRHVKPTLLDPVGRTYVRQLHHLGSRNELTVIRQRANLHSSVLYLDDALDLVSVDCSPVVSAAGGPLLVANGSKVGVAFNLEVQEGALPLLGSLLLLLHLAAAGVLHSAPPCSQLA